jgi:hypothetical protein
MVILGRQVNLSFYQYMEWAGDYIPLGNGYYASLGDLIQWLGYAFLFWFLVSPLILAHRQTQSMLL